MICPALRPSEPSEPSLLKCFPIKVMKQITVRVFGGGFINWSGILSKISKDLHCDVLYIVPTHCISFQSFFLLKQGLHDVLVFYHWKRHQHHDCAQIVRGAPSPWTPSGLQMKLFCHCCWSLGKGFLFDECSCQTYRAKVLTAQRLGQRTAWTFNQPPNTSVVEEL